MKLGIKRVYLPPAHADGRRILVDRLWPRGLARADARIDHWAKDAAPSTALRKWYGHDPEKWDEFRRRYFAELDAMPEAVAALREAIGRGTATLLYSSKAARLHNAAALKRYLERGQRRAARVSRS